MNKSPIKQLSTQVPVSYPTRVIDKDGISVHQRGYIDNMVSKFKADPDSKTTSPTSTDFVNIEERDDKIEVTKYVGIVMSYVFSPFHSSKYPHASHLSSQNL
jgi:hypothetical protein